MVELPLAGLTGAAWMYGPSGCVASVPPATVVPVVLLALSMLVHMLARAGGVSACWILYSSTWLRKVCKVDAIEFCRASLDALVNWGITIAARMPRMITTIRISTKGKPRELRFMRISKKMPFLLTQLQGSLRLSGGCLLA